MQIFEQLDRSSLYETVYSQISLALVEGRLQPDDKVRIRALAEQLGVSVTPVRDALLRLVREHALEMRGLKDIRVPCMQIDQFQEIRLIRLELEGLAARLVAQNSNRHVIDMLGDILTRNEESRTKGDVAQSLKLNRLFHSKIAEFSGLPVLCGMIENMWLRMGPIIASVYVRGGQTMIAFHYDILDAIRRKDAAAAASAIKADINATAEIVLTSGILKSPDVEAEPRARVG